MLKAMNAHKLETLRMEGIRQLNNIDDENLLAKAIAAISKVTGKKAATQSVWETAIAEGAVSPEQYHALFEKEIKENW